MNNFQLYMFLIQIDDADWKTRTELFMKVEAII